ncbi:lipopolysaccharide assembly protein LapB [Pontibacter sp. HSC-36F09]|uniref:tetratricopeptide repeat protein n=1 Tax=Pontibacter sp. HSC-36F09 TaxID=2910966 RepID=UPI00209C8703|nr:hypothetical protein [Pontibacter sp. HSC-36F09]MCP2043705.1 hypothetical protein [Pontibacter sp. HSC-36F09]
MLLRLCVLLMLMTGTGSACLAQFTASDIRQLHNAARYTGSEEDLLKILGKNIRYPAAAQRANKVGTAVGVIKFSRSGDVVEFGTLNKAFSEFKKEFERMVPLIKGKWTATNDTAQFFYAVIPVQFKIIGVGYTLNSDLKPDFFKETIMTIASGVPRDKMDAVEKQAVGVYQRMEDELVAQVNAYVQSENYTEAITAMEELVNLQPLHTAYYQPLITLHERIGNEQEATYYREVVQLFIK